MTRGAAIGVCHARKNRDRMPGVAAHVARVDVGRRQAATRPARLQPALGKTVDHLRPIRHRDPDRRAGKLRHRRLIAQGAANRADEQIEPLLVLRRFLHATRAARSPEHQRRRQLIHVMSQYLLAASTIEDLASLYMLLRTRVVMGVPPRAGIAAAAQSVRNINDGNRIVLPPMTLPVAFRSARIAAPLNASRRSSSWAVHFKIRTQFAL